MFVLTTIEDLIQVTPQNFDKPSAQAVKDAINTKYSNKVIQNIGLCICMWDLLKASDGMIGHGTGMVNVNVEFRMTVFRPFRGEVLWGRIRSADEAGMCIDLDFTSEVFIPYQNLFPNCTFDPGEGLWIWRPQPSQELFFDIGEPVLFRVEQEEWFDQKPSVTQRDENGDLIERGTPWRLVGSMNQSGLGPSLWWVEPEEEDAEDDKMGLDGPNQ